MKQSYRIGIDVGGTFTDLVLLDELTGQTFTHKVSSTPSAPHMAPIQGIKDLFLKYELNGEQVSFIGLGTTVATNAFLENKAACTALITTKGFRDLLEIARQQRPKVYDPFQKKLATPVDRAMRFEVTERIGADGQVLAALDELELERAIEAAREGGAQCVAICFLNSYVNPEHELRAVELCRRLWPEAYVASSAETMREFREYERFLTTVINVSLTPLLHQYFSRFSQEIAKLGIPVEPWVMNSSGGVVACSGASGRPVDTIFSGPSGGVSSAIFMGETISKQNLITFDMGGTSTEVCAIQNLRAQKVYARSIKGYPLKVASYDIHTIGAGGSSIAAIDDGGAMSVGPSSAGADPGPACYNKGGDQPTVTDANVVLGRLNPDYLLAGSLKIDKTRSFDAVDLRVSEPKGLTTLSAAYSIVALAEANMAQAIRVVSVERGLDPADFSLVALGGAGPLHAASVAKEVGMKDVIIPPDAGVFCALGVLTKDIQSSVSRTVLMSSGDPDSKEALLSVFQDMEDSLQSGAQACPSLPASLLKWQADVRYRGQNHEITIDIPRGELDERAMQLIKDTFHAAHEELFGYSLQENALDFVTLRIDCVTPIPRPIVKRADSNSASVNVEVTSNRQVYFEGESRLSCPVYQRAHLSSGDIVLGPAIIEQMDSTTIIPPAFQACIDPWQNIVITW